MHGQRNIKKKITWWFPPFLESYQTHSIECNSESVSANSIVISSPPLTQLNIVLIHYLFCTLFVDVTVDFPYVTSQISPLWQYKLLFCHFLMFFAAHLMVLGLPQGCRVCSKLCTVAPSICVCSVWNSLLVALLATRILRCQLDIWKSCAFRVCFKPL
jgi:hypothetical protein